MLKALMAQYAASAGIIGAKVLKDAAIGALVDYVLQAGLNWAFFAEDDATFTQILSDVDLYQVGASAFENSFSSAIVSERTQMFISAGVSCIFDGSFENGKLRDDFDIQSCAIGVASAVIANKVSHFALEKISNLSADKIRRGLQRLGIEAEKWPDVLAWLGIRNADDVIASGFDRFRRYGDLIKRLDDLDKVTPGSKQSFLNDFANASDEVVEILGRRPELVDSWKLFKEAKLGDVLRKNISHLESVSDYLKKYPNKLDDFKVGLTKAVDKNIFLNRKLYAQKLGRNPSSTVLGENLEAVGKVRPSNSAAHHMVPSGHSNDFADQARNILKREGIDINEASNGVFLPKSSKYVIDDAIAHTKVHTKVYFEEIFNRLNNAPVGKVRSELDKIAQELLNGTFPY